ncbi:hypothetical protein GE115_13090 [Agromyces sp. CFH 90414]|uniref:Uncharacterized protein n=1 Tax=Agromyces agglutinans TaxID=2662258 RepID=A0A6I2FE49_9MICO|nr:hypothetical protein [Agromyces agglutinans]MRG60796.1 hypothetical protein [Agromyces agglutinans]
MPATIRPATHATRLGTPTEREHPMHLAHAIAAAHLAGRATARLHRATEGEVAEAEQRAVARARRAADAAASARPTARALTERGRHLARPRPKSA